MSFTDRLAEKYSDVFSLPGGRMILGGTLIFGILLGTLVYIIKPLPSGPIFGVVDGFFSMAIGSIIAAYIIFKVAGNGIFTFRRTTALTAVGLVFLGIALLASALVSRGMNNLIIFNRMYFLSAGIVVAFSYILLATLSDASQLKLFLLSFAQPVLILIFHSALIYTFFAANSFTILTYFAGFLAVGIVAYILGRWFYLSIEKPGKDLLGFSSIALLKAFLNAFMLDKTESLEGLLKSLAVRSDIEVRTLSFESKDQQGIIVAPLIHPGPFGNMGSSKLPTSVAVHFLKEKIFPVVFHTPSTHDKDLVLASDRERVMQVIYNMNGNETAASATPIIIKKKGTITVNCQIFDSTPFVVITRSPLPTEDLPDYVYDMCMKEISKNGYSDGIVVDAHNAVDRAYTSLSEEDLSDLAEALSEALKEAKEKDRGKISAGFSNIKLEGYTSKEGIGDGGIMVFVVEINNAKSVYVAADANNMVVGLREKIQKALKEAGYDFSEITTTDTHVIASHSPGEPYFPLGKAIPEDVLIEKILLAVREADSKKAECSVKFSKRCIDDVYLLGNKGIEQLWKVTDETIKVAKERVIAVALLLVTSIVALYFLI